MECTARVYCIGAHDPDPEGAPLVFCGQQPLRSPTAAEALEGPEAASLGVEDEAEEAAPPLLLEVP